MKRPKLPIAFVLNFVSLALAVACSGSLSSPIGPTGSDGLGSNASGSTTIRGRTSTNRAPSSVRSTAASSPSATRVCVTGTSNCDTIDSDGQFELKGNFSGDVHLSFTSPQGNADVTVPNVQLGETIVLAVQLAGGAATVKIESRQGDGNGNAADDDSDDDAADDPSDDDSEDDDSEDDDSEDDDSKDDDSEDDDDDDSDDDDDEDDNSGKSGPGKGGRR